jgi:hypothetical protein
MTILSRLFQVDRTRGAYSRLFGNLGNPDIRVVLADLAEYCNLYRTSACISKQTGVMDPIAMAYAEGQRDALLYILRQTNADPTEVQTAIQQELENAA